MGKKLYVGNLSYNTTESDLSSTFSQCGTVESVKLITDRDTGRSKGFGFVEMATDEQAASSISKFHGTEQDGRTLTVSEAKPMAPRDNNRSGGFRPRY